MVVVIFAVSLLSRVRPFFSTPWTVTCQALLSMGFPRQEYWSGLPFASPEDLPNLGMELVSPALAGGFFTTELPRKPKLMLNLLPSFLRVLLQ